MAKFRKESYLRVVTVAFILEAAWSSLKSLSEFQATGLPDRVRRDRLRQNSLLRRDPNHGERASDSIRGQVFRLRA